MDHINFSCILYTFLVTSYIRIWYMDGIFTSSISEFVRNVLILSRIEIEDGNYSIYIYIHCQVKYMKPLKQFPTIFCFLAPAVTLIALLLGIIPFTNNIRLTHSCVVV